MKIADRRHLNKFKQPVAVEALDGKRSTIKVVEKVKIQFENKLANALVHNTAASGVFTEIHHPKAVKPMLLRRSVTNAGCNLASTKLNV